MNRWPGHTDTFFKCATGDSKTYKQKGSPAEKEAKQKIKTNILREMERYYINEKKQDSMKRNRS